MPDLAQLIIEAINKRDFDKANEYARQLVREKPDELWPNYIVGMTYMNGGKPKEALPFIKKSLEIDPQYFWSHYFLFLIFVALNDPRAIKQGETFAAMITPDNAKKSPGELRHFFITLAHEYEKKGDREQSRNVLLKSFSFLPRDPWLRSRYAGTFFIRDDLVAMKKWMKLTNEEFKYVPKSQRTAKNTYALPLRGPSIKVHQGNNDVISHRGVFGGFAWDFVFVDALGRYEHRMDTKEGHFVFGAPIYAAADGKVIAVSQSDPDTEPGKNDPRYVGNYILIRHDHDEESFYAHVKQYSSKVRVGDMVSAGQMIAKVGCSGKYVDFPHLHFMIRKGFSMEAKLTGFKLLQNGKWVEVPEYIPQKGDVLRTL
ncbi:peptidoglycan DD-metalloendopeptidase family protein [Candidatus Woesearchaeota archaeon]|nr:peptidoglycan DD-metalloendopeptidase family protein [Candidatus Woesearchaeota archaeon]